MPQQFENDANPDMHRRTTAREILSAAGGKLDCFVAGVGTGGTITGVGEVLKKENPSIKIIAVEPETSAVLSGKQAGPHKIQGIGAGFVPKVLNRNIIDEVITVKDNDAFKTSKLLAQKEPVVVVCSRGVARRHVRQPWEPGRNLGIPENFDDILALDFQGKLIQRNARRKSNASRPNAVHINANAVLTVGNPSGKHKYADGE